MRVSPSSPRRRRSASGLINACVAVKVVSWIAGIFPYTSSRGRGPMATVYGRLRGPAAAAVMLGLACAAAAQGYPSKTIRIVVAYPMGGGAEYTARPMAQKMQERWGQPVFVESRSGGSAMIGTDYVAKSPP